MCSDLLHKSFPAIFVPGIKEEYFHINRYLKVLRDVYFTATRFAFF